MSATGNNHTAAQWGGSELTRVADGVVRNLALQTYPPVEFMELFLTENCNLRCDYCFVHGRRRKRMRPDVATKAIDFLIKESRGVTDLTVLFFGGEPLLELSLIEEITHYAEEKAEASGKRIHFDVTTNGTLFNEKILEFFRAHNIKYLLSVDGGQEDHDRHRKRPDGRGSFALIAEMLPMIKSYQPWLGTKMTVHPSAVANVTTNVEYLYSLGINQFLVSPAHSVPWSDTAIATFEEELGKLGRLYTQMQADNEPFRMTLFEMECKNKEHLWGCGAGRGRLCVSTGGELFGCSKLLSIKSTDEGLLPLGDVSEGFTDLTVRRHLTDPTPVYRSKCTSCGFRTVCAGGCPATNFEETGEIFVPGGISCEFTAVFERAANDLWHATGQREQSVTQGPC